MQEAIQFEREGSTLTAKLCCELDHHRARGLREEVDHRLFVEKPSLLILDFSAVPFTTLSHEEKRLCMILSSSVAVLQD